MPPKATKPSAPTTGPRAAKKYQKAAPKPPKPLEDQLKRHFGSLCAQIDGGHLKNAIKTCEKILRLAPDDIDALQAKLFLLVQTDQYSAALDLIQTIAASHPTPLNFERAYLLYRLQREDEADEIVASLKRSGDQSRGLQHLEAQLKYREAEYDDARDLYNQLLGTCPADTDEYPDLVTNLNATQAHLDFLENGWLRSLDTIETPVAALEESGAPALAISQSVLPTTVSTSAPTQRASVAAEAPAPKPKPPKKSRLPKHVVLGVTPMPDPERWLKKKERTRIDSRAGKKGKRKEGMTAGNTQGSTMPERSSTPVATSAAGKKGKKGR